MLVILFHEIAGHSAFPLADATASGAFVPMDIQPLLEIHRYANVAATNWYQSDAVRDPVNPATHQLHIQSATAEDNSYPVDLAAGGVTTRTTGQPNTIFAAWGRPVGGICVAPATAR